jgi:glycosyltransferase involved in cell wall biosynthesis
VTSIVLTSYRPHRPAGGAPLRNWQNIKALSSLGPVDVVSVCVDDAGETVEGIREWIPFSSESRTRWDRFKTACSPLRPGVHPAVDAYHSRPVTAWLRQRASGVRYDVAVIETISLAAYLDDLKRVARRVIFDAHNVEGSLYPALTAADAHTSFAQRLKNRVLSRRMLANERRTVNGADLIWACSDIDAQGIAQVYGRRSGVTVVPNAVDVDAYRGRGASLPGADWSGTPLTLVYPGLFAYQPNEDAALRLVREVLPAIRARGVAARVVLVGRDPTPALRDAAGQVGDVELTGAVESALPYLERPCIVTLPIQVGSGTRLKILEAFAVGRPVISTAKGAEGLAVIDGEHVLIRDEVEAMAAAAIDLWHRPQQRLHLCKRALALVRARYSWSVAFERIAQSLGVAPNSPRATGKRSGDERTITSSAPTPETIH